MKSNKKILTFALCFCIASYAILVLTGNVAFAAQGGDQTSNILSAGTGLNSDFDAEFYKISHGLFVVANVVAIVMTAVAGIMVAWGIEDGKKTIWNWILGVGLAVNFGSFLVGTGLNSPFDASWGGGAVHTYTPNLDPNNGANNDILSGFMDNFVNGIIKPGAANILPYCEKILIILAIIEAGWELSFKLISGDKVKYLLTMVIKIGLFMWIMSEWIPLCDALQQGFQQTGFDAGDPAGTMGLTANSIANNADKMTHAAYQLFDAVYSNSSFIKDGVGLTLITVCCLVAMVLSLFMAAIEMFLARVEFYTMALICLPLLPFAITQKFGFLADKAIGAIFNLAIKVCCIAFIQAFSVPFLASFAEKFVQTKGGGNSVGVLVQAVLACLIVYYLTKKIPELVTGLLSGQPQLAGASMVDTAKGVAATGVAAAGAVASAGGSVAAARAASIAAGGKGGVKGTLAQLGKAAVMSRSPVQKYRNATKRIDDLIGPGRMSASKMRANMKAGRGATQDSDKGGSVSPKQQQQMKNLPNPLTSSPPPNKK